MKWITVNGIRDAEQKTFSQRNFPSYTAMCRAGASVARTAQQVAGLADCDRYVVLCGTGNNGGDGFIAARCLYLDGCDVRVFMTCVPALLKGDAARAWKDMAAVGLQAEVLPSDDAWLHDPWADPAVNPRKALIIDALLGIGATGAPRDAVAAAIRWINATVVSCPVLSIDVPSGLNANTGEALGETVRADITLTFTRPKIGFANPSARTYLGTLLVADLGFPADIVEANEVETANKIEMITEPEIRTFLRPDRYLDSHKYTYGHALVVGGCEAYPHAPIFSAYAAYRAGCGLVTLSVPQASRPAAAQWVPEAIFAPLPIPSAASALVGENVLPAFDLSKYKAIAIGPGLGTLGPAHSALLRHLISDPGAPRTVVDADALTHLAYLHHTCNWQPDGTALRTILTPHPGEAARLLKTTIDEIQRDRPTAARKIAAEYHAIVILKGHNTLVAEPGGRLHICMGGNPGMATAGTGDILTGLVVGLLARGLGTEDAACLAVARHANAGDMAALLHGQESLVASDLLKHLRF